MCLATYGLLCRVDAVDPALRRSGRFDAEIEVSTPTEEERFQILKVKVHNLIFVHVIWSDCVGNMHW